MQLKSLRLALPLLLVWSGCAYANLVSSSQQVWTASQAQAAKASSEQSASTLESTMGITGYQALATPAASGAAGASSQTTGSAEISCSAEHGASGSIAGVAYVFEGCSSTSGTIKSVTLEICDNDVSGGMCTPSNFSAPTTYPAGQYTAIQNGYLGIGCDDSTGQCEITVKSSFSLSGSGGQITSEAQQDSSGQVLRQMLSSSATSATQDSSSYTATSQGALAAASTQQSQASSEVGQAESSAASPVATPNNANSFQNAMVAGGIATGISQSTNPTGAATVQVFSGTDMRCTTPIGMFGNSFSANCCELGLTNSANGFTGSCTTEEVKLAAARRALRTVYIGSYCSKEQNLLFFSRCIQQTQTYCSFNGILSKLVQEQGRQQLSSAASSANATAQTRALTFPLYNGAGGWTTPLDLNQEWISIFEAPASCQTTQGADGANCPVTLQVWFAVCSKTSGCGALPQNPYDGSTTWQLDEISTLSQTQQALSEHVVAQGSCSSSSNSCDYAFTAWPASSNGDVVITKQLEFLATDPASTISEALVGNDAIEVNSPGLSLGSTWPSSITAKVSTDGGMSWSSFQLPLSISTPISVGDGSTASWYRINPSYWSVYHQGVSITGGCDTTTGLCQYEITGQVKAVPKPWGNPKNPDCSGFTISQLSMLDFSKMNLSQWVQNVSGTANVSESQIISTALASANASQTAPSASSADSADDNPVPTQTAIVTPTEGMGPFTAVLDVAPQWQGDISGPEPIYGVTINWGDCSGDTTATHLVTGGFRAYHVYKSPASPGMCDSSGPSGPGDPRNLKNTITLWINAKNGTHVLHLQEMDDFNNYSAGY